MRAPEVWSTFGVSGGGAVIAVIDTGVCWTHSDIANQMWVNPGEVLGWQDNPTCAIYDTATNSAEIISLKEGK